MKDKYIIILVTAPLKNVDKLVQHLIAQKLVACVNKILSVESVYWWENKICKDKEILLIMKTKKSLFNKIVVEIKKVHPYKVPEIISIPIIAGNKEYLAWIRKTVI